jgi:septum formation protein
MNKKHKLYLASQSPIRSHLLEKAHIPFAVIQQAADERSISWNQPPKDVVRFIAALKMEHAALPGGKEREQCFVLTADTICTDTTGTIHGKPRDYADAKSMIILWRSGCSITTGFCLEKKIYVNGQWATEKRTEQQITSSLIFSIPDQWIDSYLRETKPLEIAGAVAIEGYGFQFVKSINGSYTGILGLPMYELIEALIALGFF